MTGGITTALVENARERAETVKSKKRMDMGDGESRTRRKEMRRQPISPVHKMSLKLIRKSNMYWRSVLGFSVCKKGKEGIN